MFQLDVVHVHLLVDVHCFPRFLDQILHLFAGRGWSLQIHGSLHGAFRGTARLSVSAPRRDVATGRGVSTAIAVRRARCLDFFQGDAQRNLDGMCSFRCWGLVLM